MAQTPEQFFERRVEEFGGKAVRATVDREQGLRLIRKDGAALTLELYAGVPGETSRIAAVIIAKAMRMQEDDWLRLIYMVSYAAEITAVRTDEGVSVTAKDTFSLK